MNRPGQFAPRHLVVLLLPLVAGCTGSSITLVRGRIQPRHFSFVTVVEKTDEGPDGWRAACIHAHVQRTTGDSYICRFGVEMPIENRNGPISTPLAQRIAARCANEAAYTFFKSTTPETPLGLACEGFKKTYHLVLNRALSGSRVKTQCHEKTTPVEFSS